MYRFHIFLNDDDYFEFNRHHLFNTSLGRRRLASYRLRVVLGTLAILLGVLIMIYRFVSSLFMLQFALIMMAVTYLVVIVVFLLLSKRLAFWSTKRTLRGMKKSGRLPFAQESEMIFDDEHFEKRSSDTETRSKYSTIERIDETDRALYLYLNVNQAHIIPTSVFADATERSRFVSFLRERCSRQPQS